MRHDAECVDQSLRIFLLIETTDEQNDARIFRETKLTQVRSIGRDKAIDLHAVWNDDQLLCGQFADLR